MATTLNQRDLEALALGGCFFGSGGGGTLKSALSLARNFSDDYYEGVQTVRVLTVQEAASEARGDAVMVAYMGSPLALDGVKLPRGPVEAVQRTQQYLAQQGRTLAYLVPDESGALGFVVASLVAAKLGLAVLDADGAGRAVPELPMLTYAASDVPPCPAYFDNGAGVCVGVEVQEKPGQNHTTDVEKVIEDIARPLISAGNDVFNEIAGLAMWAMQPAQIGSAVPIQGTLTRALRLGLQLLEGHLDTVPALLHFLHAELGVEARVLFGPGKLQSATSATKGGFDIGAVTIADADGTRECTVLSQNESMLAWDSRRAAPLAMAPDSLAFYAPGPGRNVFSNGDLVAKDGAIAPGLSERTFYVLVLRADPVLLNPESVMFQSFQEALRGMQYYGPYTPPAPASEKGLQ